MSLVISKALFHSGFMHIKWMFPQNPSFSSLWSVKHLVFHDRKPSIRLFRKSDLRTIHYSSRDLFPNSFVCLRSSKHLGNITDHRFGKFKRDAIKSLSSDHIYRQLNQIPGTCRNILLISSEASFTFSHDPSYLWYNSFHNQHKYQSCISKTHFW